MINISGLTKLCGIIGDPVEHSFSPAMHNAAFRSVGLDYAYVPFHVYPDDLSQAVSAIRCLNIIGVNVTVPYKQAVLRYLNEISPEAQLIGAVNTIVNKKGRLIGYNTDGMGFVRSIKEQAKFTPHEAKVLILGAGGAARAVAVQLALSGAKIINIVNRTYERAQEIAKLIENNTTCHARSHHWKESEKLLSEVDLVVHTTSQGMYPRSGEVVNCSLNLFHEKQLVCDLIYNPPETVFLKAARKCGAKTLNGMGMLLYQGALAFEIWVGKNAPVIKMEEALMEVLNL